MTSRLGEYEVYRNQINKSLMMQKIVTQYNFNS
jgi:hypothetical protein